MTITSRVVGKVETSQEHHDHILSEARRLLGDIMEALPSGVTLTELMVGAYCRRCGSTTVPTSRPPELDFVFGEFHGMATALGFESGVDFVRYLDGRKR